MIGGETRPELQQMIFTDTYPAGTEYHQDYKECIDALHLSYALHHDAFTNDGYRGTVLQKANYIHAYMGYAFYVSDIIVYAVNTPTGTIVEVNINITQLGVAPFYYDLYVGIQCMNYTVQAMSSSGVHTIIERGESKLYTFQIIPDVTECLDNITLSLESSYAYPGRQILFAQGDNGKVSFRIPSPPPPETRTTSTLSNTSEEHTRNTVNHIIQNLGKVLFRRVFPQLHK